MADAPKRQRRRASVEEEVIEKGVRKKEKKERKPRSQKSVVQKKLTRKRKWNATKKKKCPFLPWVA